MMAECPSDDDAEHVHLVECGQKDHKRLLITHNSHNCIDVLKVLFCGLIAIVLIILSHKVLLTMWSLANSLYIKPNAFPHFDPIRIGELRTAYYNALDHNNDGIVTINELKVGILAMAQFAAFEDHQNTTCYIPHKYSCNPSLNFVDFADCLTIAARHLDYNPSSSEEVSFDTIFAIYIGQCTDTSPYSDQYCHDIVMQRPKLCHLWSMNHQPFCSLSCYACEHEPYIFTDEYPVRGTNGEYKPRVEHLSTYHKPHTHQATSAANCEVLNKRKVSIHSGQILFISDIHIEPWYNVQGTSTVSRFEHANLDNMWQCRNNNEEQVLCSLTGDADPPINLWQSALQFFKHHASSQDLHKDILIMTGDTQAHCHHCDRNDIMYQSVTKLMNKVLDEILSSFDAASVFYAAGNNDGEHNIIFCQGSDPIINAKWANSLISHEIVTNDLNRLYAYDGDEMDQITLFSQTGYYIKKIPDVFWSKSDSESFYAIILNTNLGVSNALQHAVLIDDLEWIKAQPAGHVLVIGHHPDIVSSIVPNEYQSLVSGSFAGHVHYFAPSDSKSFSILPATTQGSPYAAVVTGELNAAGNIMLDWKNFNQYLGKKHTVPQENCWGFIGPQ